MFFDINKSLCEQYALNPLELLYYPADDVFDLINGTLDYHNRDDVKAERKGVIRKQAGDNWF